MTAPFLPPDRDRAAARGAHRPPAARGDRWWLAALLVLAAVPLAWPAVPPLVDLPNHMSRYRVGLEPDAPGFAQWFSFHWVLVGNLGVDLAVTALSPLIGLEPATKLVVGATPVLMVAGLLLIAREVHGRVPRTTAFAAVFAYNWPFNFGFVNFTLSAALALLVFGLWLRLGRLGHARMRAALLLPLGLTVWLAHAAGWGLLGLLVLGWATADARTAGAGIARAAAAGARTCLPLTAPLLPMLLWSARVPAQYLATVDPDPVRKVVLLFLALRDGVPIVDWMSMVVVLTVLVATVRGHLLRFDPRLAACGALLVVVYALMPADLLGSGHADLRIAPYAMAILLLAVRPIDDRPGVRSLGMAALAFYAGLMGYHAVHYARIAAAQARSLAALDHLPTHVPVYGYARVGCSFAMQGNRMDHVNRMAVVRNRAFTNGNWPPPGIMTLRVNPAMIAGYTDDGGQMLQPAGCRQPNTYGLRHMLRTLPRDRYRYLWLLDMPRTMRPTRAWLRPVWWNDATILYAVAPPGAERGWRGADRTPARRLP